METLGESITVKTPLAVGENKLKRRRCYECNEKGHISSLCPKNQLAADVTLSVTDGNKNKKKKKKVIRLVKKIVKKKVLKKVPKPKTESKKSNCDSFGSNDTSAVMGIEKGENVTEEEKKGVCLVENCDNNLTDNDGMEIEKRAENKNKKKKVIRIVKKIVKKKVLKRIPKPEKSNVKDVEAHLVERDKDGDNNGIELQISEHNRLEDKEGVQELVVNSETDGSKLEECLSESRVVSGQMVVSWWHMKRRRKIFVHGLDKETKEEDIRNVFGKVGEVVGVKLIRNLNTGKSRGFGFVKYASAGLVDSALKKFRHVEIRGSTWHTAAVEGNDTITLSNIDKKWNNENVLALLQKVGITKIDEVSVVPDPENTELNRGFAFIEFETKRDAQMAYRKLQIKNVFGEYSRIKVVWAESLADPVNEEMHNVMFNFKDSCEARHGFKQTLNKVSFNMRRYVGFETVFESRGFGFVTYASAGLADSALKKFRHVEIRGSTWHTAAVEGNDTITLSNIDKKWNNENVLALLQKVGITKIDEVSVVPDPENTELNRGFAFIEFETKRDAQMAYRKLQIKNVFGEYSKIKVAWAELLADPVEEEMHNGRYDLKLQ